MSGPSSVFQVFSASAQSPTGITALIRQLADFTEAEAAILYLWNNHLVCLYQEFSVICREGRDGRDRDK